MSRQAVFGCAFWVCLIFAAVCVRAEEPTGQSPGDWRWWRGPHNNGAAAAGQDPPISWSESENVRWKQAVPGRGHGSPIVVGKRVLLQAADAGRKTQSVLCWNADDGALLWETIVHRGGLTPKPGQGKMNKKASSASSTPASDGNHIYVNFLNDGAVHTTALNMDGETVWRTKITDYVQHQGYGSSPALFGDLVIVSADNKSGGAVAGLDRMTGKVIWRQERPKTPNYPSPIVLKAAGTTQLLLTGCDLVSSFDPLTGKKNWEIDGATTECVTSTVTSGGLIFSSGGYPRNHMAAIKADGSGEIAWENNVRVYVPSMLTRDGCLYAVADAGIAMCLDAATGKTLWKARVPGEFTSSPVLVGDRIYATSETGTTYVFRATPDEFSQIAKNQLGDSVLSTPAVAHHRIYTRVAFREGDARQEYIYCLGK